MSPLLKLLRNPKTVQAGMEVLGAQAQKAYMTGQKEAAEQLMTKWNQLGRIMNRLVPEPPAATRAVQSTRRATPAPVAAPRSAPVSQPRQTPNIRTTPEQTTQLRLPVATRREGYGVPRGKGTPSPEYTAAVERARAGLQPSIVDQPATRFTGPSPGQISIDENAAGQRLIGTSFTPVGPGRQIAPAVEPVVVRTGYSSDPYRRGLLPSEVNIPVGPRRQLSGSDIPPYIRTGYSSDPYRRGLLPSEVNIPVGPRRQLPGRDISPDVRTGYSSYPTQGLLPEPRGSWGVRVGNTTEAIPAYTGVRTGTSSKPYAGTNALLTKFSFLPKNQQRAIVSGGAASLIGGAGITYALIRDNQGGEYAAPVDENGNPDLDNALPLPRGSSDGKPDLPQPRRDLDSAGAGTGAGAPPAPILPAPQGSVAGQPGSGQVVIRMNDGDSVLRQAAANAQAGAATFQPTAGSYQNARDYYAARAGYAAQPGVMSNVMERLVQQDPRMGQADMQEWARLHPELAYQMLQNSLPRGASQQTQNAQGAEITTELGTNTQNNMVGNTNEAVAAAQGASPDLKAATDPQLRVSLQPIPRDLQALYNRTGARFANASFR